MQDKLHEMVSDLLRVASELGKTPTAYEYYSAGQFSERQIINAFKNYIPFCAAAGLKPNKRKKIDNTVFERDLEQHLADYKPRPFSQPANLPTLAIISDIHWPFCNQRVIDKFYEYIAEFQPDFVILNGDAWDMYSHARFPRSHNVFTPREEQRMAREANVAFWAEVQKRTPNSKCYQMLGNHDIRPLKKVLIEYPEAEDWIADKLKELFTFEKVTTIHDPREELKIDEDTLVFHGYRSKLGDHRDFTLMNSHVGHTHHGGCVYRTVRGKVIYECNSGFAGDAEAKGLAYTPQKATTQTPGFSARDKWGARFIAA